MPRFTLTFITAAIVLWAVVLAGAWVPVDRNVLMLAVAGGSVCWVMAGLHVMLRTLIRTLIADKKVVGALVTDKVVRSLAETVIATRRAALRETRPLHAVHR